MNSRQEAISKIALTQAKQTGVDYAKESLSDIFGCHVFSDRVMRERLPKDTFRQLQRTIRNREPLNLAVADVVANAMKDWAMEMGATHYTHWFQPMTGNTAEKHDAFLEISGGQIITEFSGKMLIKGEPDASSFPSGGIRSTFEARGYTAWDATSPAFIRENTNGRTLCIPTAFCSYTGEALDRKTPLLRSIESLSNQALRILKLFGNTSATHVNTTLGCEQEYFLIDRQLFLQRQDLVIGGRTLYGRKPPKGQELEDHYFGAIRPRVLAFMADLEKKLYKLGIPVKTRHNEVSPAQFEIAPIFEAANVAVDHNMLTMEVMRSTAEEHGLVCLLHEKPFAGVNGSGKHNNWSMCDSDGNNLLDPGDTPQENAQFLVYLACIMRAVHTGSAALRIAVAGAGNDHRLGANEAPPAILSIFLGAQLDEVVENIIAGKKKVGKHGGVMQIGVNTLPPLPKDATDRNRTSPFAFTGNKFEFRAVGSSQSCAPANIALNTFMAEAMDYAASTLEKTIKSGQGLNQAVQSLLQEMFKEHHAIIFNGDNYSASWPIEAEKRGLLNLRNTVDTLERFSDKAMVQVFEKYKVLSKREIHSRQEILFEQYVKSISIEAQTCASIARGMILPAALQYQKDVAENVKATRAALGENAPVGAQLSLLEELGKGIQDLFAATIALDEARAKAEESNGHIDKKARVYLEKVLPLMLQCRAAGDHLEMHVSDELWPMPKYREMLFIY
jgi:glutamine synthetase